MQECTLIYLFEFFFFFSYFQDKIKFLTSLSGKGSKKNMLILKDLKVQICTKNEMCIVANEHSLPVIFNDLPTSFSEEDYFKVSFRIIVKHLWIDIFIEAKYTWLKLFILCVCHLEIN